jgi:F0F1-type ATP synthase epsilon subunit
MDIDVTNLTTRPTIDVDKLFVSVYLTSSLHELGFKGFAKSISTEDSKGPFDILPAHENFVTEFSGKLEIVPVDGDKIVYQSATGVVEIANNVARIFLEVKK